MKGDFIVGKKFDKNAELFPGLSTLKIGDALSGPHFEIRFRIVLPSERGHFIQTTGNIRECPIMALVGPVSLKAPELRYDAVREHFEKLILRHGNRTARRAAAKVIEVEPDYLTSELLEGVPHAGEFCHALLVLDVNKAAQLLNETDWPNDFDRDRAQHLLDEVRTISQAFELQRTAGWAYRMIHAPFDNALGEANYDGDASVGGCLRFIEFWGKLAADNLALFRSGADDVSRRRFRFLDRLGLTWLRTKEPGEIYAIFGEERMAQLWQILDNMEAQAKQREEIMAEVARFDQVANENGRQGSRGKRLDALLTPVSGVVILAMQCATFAQVLTGLDGDQASQPPRWLIDPYRAKDEFSNGAKKKFYDLFLLYRGLLVDDDPSNVLNLPGNECLLDGRAEQLSNLYRLGARQAPEVIKGMRLAVASGLYGIGPEGRGSASEFGRKFGWREAA